MSSLETRRILGSTGRLSWISCGFALLLRFDDGVTEGITCMGDERVSECNEARLDPLPPIGIILNLVGVGMVCSDGDTMFIAGLTGLEFEGMDGGSAKKIGDVSDVLKFIIHGDGLYVGNRWIQIL